MLTCGDAVEGHVWTQVSLNVAQPLGCDIANVLQLCQLVLVVRVIALAVV